MYDKRYLQSELVKSIFVGIFKKIQTSRLEFELYSVTFSEQLFYQAVYMLKVMQPSQLTFLTYLFPTHPFSTP